MTTLIMSVITVIMVFIAFMVFMFWFFFLVVPIRITTNITLTIHISAAIDVVNTIPHIPWSINRGIHRDNHRVAWVQHRRCNINLRQRCLNDQLRRRYHDLRSALHILHVLYVMWPRLRCGCDQCSHGQSGKSCCFCYFFVN